MLRKGRPRAPRRSLHEHVTQRKGVGPGEVVPHDRQALSRKDSIFHVIMKGLRLKGAPYMDRCVLRDAGEPKDNLPGDMDGALRSEKPCVKGPGIDNNYRGLWVPKGKGKYKTPFRRRLWESWQKHRETPMPVGFPLGLHKLHDGIHISRNEGPYSNILLNIARHQHRKREGQDRREITGLIRWLRWCKEKVTLLSEREWHIGKAFRASLPCHAGAAGLTQPAGTWKADVCRHHWAGRAVSRVLSECREWLSRLLGINTAGITSRLVVKAAMTGVIGRRLEMAAPSTS